MRDFFSLQSEEKKLNARKHKNQTVGKTFSKVHKANDTLYTIEPGP